MVGWGKAGYGWVRFGEVGLGMVWFNLIRGNYGKMFILWCRRRV